MKETILIVEDDAAIAEAITHNLEREGFEVKWFADGKDGYQWAYTRSPDLIILDLMLPTKAGLDICRDLRGSATTRNTPILMLTAKSDEMDQVVGFSVGADDYVTKPFSVKVLLQRVRALLKRRTTSEDANSRLELHGIVIDRRAHEVFTDGEPVPLTPTEYRLLETLMRQPSRAFNRTELLDAAVGEETIVLERTIDVHIRSLRRKLGRRAKAIQTVRGLGYRFARNLAE